MLEIIWTCIGLIGLYFGSANVRDSRKTITALRVMNGKTFAQHRTMQLMAYGHFRNDLFRLSAHVTITAIGLISMLLPPASGPGSAKVSPVGILVTSGFFFIALEIVISSILDKNQRNVLEDHFTNG